MMTRRHPYLNVLRGSIAAFSAGLGGADSVSVLPHPLAVGFPGGLSRRLARNGQLVLLRRIPPRLRRAIRPPGPAVSRR